MAGYRIEYVGDMGNEVQYARMVSAECIESSLCQIIHPYIERRPYDIGQLLQFTLGTTSRTAIPDSRSRATAVLDLLLVLRVYLGKKNERSKKTSYGSPFHRASKSPGI
jgi:hypothetical protein